jgi:hypothetical protein
MKERCGDETTKSIVARLYIQADLERTARIQTKVATIRQAINDSEKGDADYASRLIEFIEQLEREMEPRKKVRNARESRKPPMLAEFILAMLLKPSRSEAVIGDLNERFTDELHRLGQRRAGWLYWARTLHSLWPLLKRATAKALSWGALIAMARRIF